MKSTHSWVSIPIIWTYHENGRVLRSTKVGNYRAEIKKSYLAIISDNGVVVSSVYCYSKATGIEMANKRLSVLLNPEMVPYEKTRIPKT